MDRQLLAGILLVTIGVIGVVRRTAHAEAQRTWLRFWGFKDLETRNYRLFYGVLGSILVILGAAVLLSRLLS